MMLSAAFFVLTPALLQRRFDEPLLINVSCDPQNVNCTRTCHDGFRGRGVEFHTSLLKLIGSARQRDSVGRTSIWMP